MKITVTLSAEEVKSLIGAAVQQRLGSMGTVRSVEGAAYGTIVGVQVTAEEVVETEEAQRAGGTA